MEVIPGLARATLQRERPDYAARIGRDAVAIPFGVGVAIGDGHPSPIMGIGCAEPPSATTEVSTDHRHLPVGARPRGVAVRVKRQPRAAHVPPQRNALTRIVARRRAEQPVERRLAQQRAVV